MKKIFPYLITLGIILFTGYMKIYIQNLLIFESPLLLFFTAIGACAWVGGINQGLFGTVLSIIFIQYYFIPPTHSFKGLNQMWTYRLIFYSVDCFALSVICGGFRLSSQKLEESETRLQKFFDSNMIGILFTDFKGHIHGANDYFLKTVGYTEADLKAGKLNWELMTPPEYIEISRKNLEILRHQDTIPPFEKQYVRADGSLVGVLIGAARVGEDSIVTFVLNIDERKKSDRALEEVKNQLEERVLQRTQQLRESESFLDSVIENIPNMIFVKDAKDLRFVRFNQAGLKLLQQPLSNLMGKNDYDFFPKEQADAFTKKDRDVLSQNQMVDIPEEPLQTPNGIRFLHTKKIPLIGKSGRPEYLLGISEDITEKKIAEKQKYELAQEQAARTAAEINAERLATLAHDNERLLQKANEASEAKSSFLANMSHEIRTPLGAMLGFAELANDPNTDAADREKYLSTILRNGHQLLGIVDEILDLSKVESERIQIEKVPFSIHKLLDEISALLSIKASEKGLQLKFDVDANIPDKIVSDPTRLRQILLNVIGNAIKFSEKGTVTVAISAELIKKGIHRISFAVKDTGIGIQSEQARHLFQAFTQADSSTTRRFGGTGLGLFLARRLARLLDGDVVLEESQYGIGSTFMVTITGETALSSSQSETIAESKSAVTSPLSKASFHADASALIVDDSADNRDLLAAYFNKMAIPYDVAENGREAVEKATQKKYDLILMDIQMPEMDGFEAVRILRQEKHAEAIVALTAHAMKGDREKCLAAGFTDYLYKPLNREALNQVLKKYLEQKSL